MSGKIGAIVAIIGIALLAVGIAGGAGVPGLSVVTGHPMPPHPSITIHTFTWSFDSLSGTFSVTGGSIVLTSWELAVSTGTTTLTSTKVTCGMDGAEQLLCAMFPFTYPGAGTYSVQAYAYGWVGGAEYSTKSAVATLVVTSAGVGDPHVTASFSDSQTPNTYLVTFKDASTASGGATLVPADTKWTINGASRSGDTANYTFPTYGKYSATITVYATAANGTLVHNQTTQSVDVANQGCVNGNCQVEVTPGFAWTITGPPANETVKFVSFSNVSNGYIEATVWSFGDGGSNATGNSTTHVYSSYGTSLVTETVSAANSYGSTQTVSVVHNVTLTQPTQTCQETGTCNPCVTNPSSCTTNVTGVFAVNAINGALIFGGIGLAILGGVIAIAKHPVIIVVGGVVFVALLAAGYFLGSMGLL
ncbi:MAG: PKD domain-containing protein [Thermoplasmata archaeon]